MTSSREDIAIDKIINYKRAIHIECQLRMMSVTFGRTAQKHEV